MEETKGAHNDPQVTHVEAGVNLGDSSKGEEWSKKALTMDAQDGFVEDKELGPLAALKAYPKAVMWALVMSTCVIMEGYDTALLGSFFAYRM